MVRRGVAVVVVAGAVALLSSCYSPSFDRCAVQCTTTSGCPGDLQCTGGYCLAPGDEPCGGLASARSISAGDRFTCLVDDGGRLYCWGLGAFGQLGDGGGGDSNVAVRVGADEVWASVEAGRTHACGLREGQVWCWGDDSEAQCGRGQPGEPRLPGPINNAGVDEWALVTAGSGFTCAITADRALYCWGSNEYRKLGIGSDDLVTFGVPNRVGTANDWTAVSAGSYHACGIRADNRLYCWGGDAYGQLGNGADPDANAPIEIAHPEGGGWSDVGAGYLHTCALDLDRELWCWGAADQTGGFENVLSPQRVGAAGAWDALFVGQLQTCVVREGVAWCFGDNQGLQLLTREQPRVLTPIELEEAHGIVAIASGVEHMCAVFQDGPVSCWGTNGVGEIGNGVTADKPAPTAVAPGMEWRDVATGTWHTCGVTTGGELYCWGWNGESQLGTGDAIESLTPARVGTGSAWTHVSAGHQHSCALAAGDAWCWGYDDFDQVGNGARGKEITPRQVSTSAGLTALSLGYAHSLAIGPTGARWGWGGNSGLGLTGLATPTPTELTNGVSSFSAIDSGLYSGCGIETPGGALWCWGENNRGQAGQPASPGAPFEAPIQVGADTGWTQVSAGRELACGVRGGEAYCWGNGETGQLGGGVTASTHVPSMVPHTKAWSQVTAGERVACGLDVDGDVYCWGDGYWGALGNGTVISNQPTTPISGGPYSRVTNSDGHVCAIKADDDSLWCWGHNHRGQIGDGSGPLLGPAAVIFPE